MSIAKKRKQQKNVGEVKNLEIVDEMKDSYLNYAMSVIVARALPDVRDGLKPVQRRILYAMHEMGLKSEGRFRKSATVVGAVLGSYHPHGDQATYGSMARMAQDFSLRYPLIKPQGNFGSLDGDPPASMRYTEAKLSKIGEIMLRDIKKETVDFVDNYDGTKKEPKVLPSPLPQLLLNGCLGIAVGMATKVPPHNLAELCDAIIYLIDNPKANTKDLFKFIKGPDFPTGGVIYDREGIIEAYSQGQGPILVRGRAEIVEQRGGFQIVISEIPFGVQKPKLLEQIAKLVLEQKLKKIKDIRDESAKEGVRIVLDLKKGAYPKRVLNLLYKKTFLQTTFHLNSIALIGGIQPKVLSVLEILQEFLSHRKDVIIKRTRFDRNRAEERAHILEGFDRALKNIDAVIETIKASKDKDTAQKDLIKKFKLTEIQADAILNMKLSSLAKMERKKIVDELREIKALIKELTAILKSPKKVKDIIKKELRDYKEQFGDERKTKVFVKKADEISPEDLIPEEEVVITLTKKGLIKRLKPSVYKVQRRGGKGIIGAKTKEEDIIEHLVFVNTRDSLLFFTDSGKVFKTQAYEVPAADRTATGKSVMNFLQISSEEKVLTFMPLSRKKKKGKSYFVMATKEGMVKKVKTSDFGKVRRTGLTAINLKKNDLLVDVRECAEKDQVILISRKGKLIRFKERDVRTMGRTAMGVKGIKLDKNDAVITMEVVGANKGQLLIVSENGYGKRTRLSEYRIQKRAGKGIKTAQVTGKTGDLAAAKVLDGLEKDLILISQNAQVIRVKISSISKMGRVTQGVKVIKLGKGDKVASIVCI